MKPNTTACAAWETLTSIFHDNQVTRALQLNSKLTNTRLDNFPNASAYCQELKSLSDQLANVGKPMPDVDLVMQLITGLSEAYAPLATVLKHAKPLPTFYEARSQLILEETTKAATAMAAATTAGAALHASTNKPHPPAPDHNTHSTDFYRGRGRETGGRGRGRSRGYGGRGRASGYNYNSNKPYFGYPWPHNMQQQTYNAPWAQSGPYSWQHQTQGPKTNQPTWPTPPCPYPTVNSQEASSSNGILGPRPNQAHYTAYAPTNIEQALYTMSLNPPDSWAMDTGATQHMTNNPGNFQSFFNNGISYNIIVGNGTTIPVAGITRLGFLSSGATAAVIFII
ncbi:uncharacterized protein LOC143611098 [Bidens hawaiensis]|uniref:uncharacterized protein LOC143611098 n=1 Tax=Bidens hawaiensis TaxID=980011 RepID=UPI00404A4968